MALYRIGTKTPQVAASAYVAVEATLIGEVSVGERATVLAGGRYHPLLARYRPSLAPALASALEQRRPLQQVVAALGPAVIDEQGLARFGDPERLLFNVNTPADLERARELLSD